MVLSAKSKPFVLKLYKGTFEINPDANEVSDFLMVMVVPWHVLKALHVVVSLKATVAVVAMTMGEEDTSRRTWCIQLLVAW
eukprot:scaffold6861_cov248-Ochromonas_danica.AAC.3